MSYFRKFCLHVEVYAVNVTRISLVWDPEFINFTQFVEYLKKLIIITTSHAKKSSLLLA